MIQNIQKIPYEKIPGFGTSTGTGPQCIGSRSLLNLLEVPGHKSELAFGLLGKNGIPVVAMLGRVCGPRTVKLIHFTWFIDLCEVSFL